MIQVAVQVANAGEVLRYLREVEAMAKAWGESRVTVTSDLAYAYGIETGFHRGGGLARRAGGAYMMQQGLAETQPRMQQLIEDAFARSRPSDIPLAEANIGRMVVAAVQRYTPVVSGNLRDSFRWQAA